MSVEDEVRARAVLASVIARLDGSDLEMADDCLSALEDAGLAVVPAGPRSPVARELVPEGPTNGGFGLRVSKQRRYTDDPVARDQSLYCWCVTLEAGWMEAIVATCAYEHHARAVAAALATVLGCEAPA